MEKLISSRSAAVGRPVWLLAALRWRYSFSRSAEEVAAVLWWCIGDGEVDSAVEMHRDTQAHTNTG